MESLEVCPISFGSWQRRDLDLGITGLGVPAGAYGRLPMLGTG